MKAASSAMNVLGLPPLHRKIVLALLRQGATDPATLAHLLAVEQATVQTAIDTLLLEQQVRMTSNGAVELVLGRTRRRTLPARLWPALQAVSRLYSEQDIVSLRTALPILQFTRAKLSEFTDHGPGHVLRVKLFATQLGSVFALTAREQQLLRAASLFHDIGNMIERERHHIISQEMVEKLAET